jgi:hypothetical protein
LVDGICHGTMFSFGVLPGSNSLCREAHIDIVQEVK